MSIEVSGIFGFVLLLLAIYAIIKTLESGASTGRKVLWTVLILLIPLFGLILWFFFGPRKR